MAETIAAALVQAGWVGATAAGVKAAFTYAAYAYAAYSMYDGQKQARRAQDAARASITDRLVTTRSSAASARRSPHSRIHCASASPASPASFAHSVALSSLKGRACISAPT